MLSINAAHCLCASVIHDSLIVVEKRLDGFNDSTWPSRPFLAKMHILFHEKCRASHIPAQWNR
jgi:hypothetical protein